MKAIIAVVGARPNFMKMAPVMNALAEASVPVHLIHTGQHYDAAMKASFFGQLGIPEPEVDLGVGSGSHAVQTAEVMTRFEPVLDRFDPGAVVVVGDVNSTVACALVAVKKGVPVFHVEAGLRSFDRAMPEEINRVVTDQLSELLFTTERSARDNLEREGIADDRIHFVGNVMIDSLLAHAERAVEATATLDACGRSSALAAGDPYGVVTLHRPSNVDDPGGLQALMRMLDDLSSRLPLVFPVHPRTRARLDALGFTPTSSGLVELPPIGYLEMLGLMKGASVVLTDSGGMQEETTALGVPCLTLRDNTERPITVTEGTNTIVGTDVETIRAAFDEVLTSGGKAGRRPELWDGRSAERIARIVRGWLSGSGASEPLGVAPGTEGGRV